MSACLKRDPGTGGLSGKCATSSLLGKNLDEAEPDLLREVVPTMAERLMGAEADSLCQAGYGERSDERVNTRNGYRSRRWDTRVGTIDLAIPRLRKGSDFPDWLLEHRRRSERALLATIAECYVRGDSTRRVEGLVEHLGIEGISRSQVSSIAKELDEMVEAFRNRPLEAKADPYVWLDATYVKSPEHGRIVNVSVVVAIGCTDEGKREILGLDVFTAEDGPTWTTFLRGLVARGLSGVCLVTSDAHEGLKQAIAAVLTGASWQRCRTHFMRNLLVRVPKAAQSAVATIVRSIFAQPDADTTWRQHSTVVEQLQGRFKDVATMLDEAAPEVLAFTSFPKDHWRRVWSNNPLERLNKELRRRTDVVGIFPNRPAIVRLVGAILAEQHDAWAVGRRYLTIGSLDKLITPLPHAESQMVNGQELALTA